MASRKIASFAKDSRHRPLNSKAKFILVSAVISLLASTAYPISVNAGNTTYGYDNLGRIISITAADGTVTNYQYDAAGNRTLVQKTTSPPPPPPPSNHPPVAVNDSAGTMFKCTQKNVSVLANDSDPDNDAITITSFYTTGSVLSATESDGIINIITGQYAGAGSVHYTIDDGHGATASAVVSLTVPVNPAYCPDPWPPAPEP